MPTMSRCSNSGALLFTPTEDDLEVIALKNQVSTLTKTCSTLETKLNKVLKNIDTTSAK